jgi:hypothetical protein
MGFGLWALGFGLAIGCSGGQHPAGGGSGSDVLTPPLQDTRTPLEKRRDGACDQLGPKLTACAVEDAQADLASGKITKQQFDQDTASGVQHKNTEEFEKACKGSNMSSRQVRVLEVCFKEETACDPLRKCLENLQPKKETP